MVGITNVDCDNGGYTVCDNDSLTVHRCVSSIYAFRRKET